MQLGRDSVRERRRRGVPLCARLDGEIVDARLSRIHRGCCGRRRIGASVERRQFLARLGRTLHQLLVRRDAEPALRLGDSVQPGLELLQPARLRLERGEKRAQLGCGLAQPELDIAQLVARPLQLRREALERRDRPLGERDETGRAFAVLRGERIRRSGCRLGELGHVTQPLPVGAQPLLVPLLHAFRVLRQRAQLGQTGLGERRIRGQLLVALAGYLQLAPCGSQRLAVDAGETIQQLELVRRPREAPLLELARHRDDPLDRGGDVLACRSTAPGVRARPPVCEHAARNEQHILVLRAKVGELLQLVRKVELGLDVGLLSTGPDERVVALHSEEKADRLREDRLARPGLTGDGVQTRRELEFGLADEDEVLDAQASQHGIESRQGG